MNPNREHIDDEVTVNEGAVAEFKQWLTRPPRRGKREMIVVPVAVVFAIGWFAYVIATGSGMLPGGGVVIAGLAWGFAEILPARAVRAVISLRLAGTVLFVVGPVSWMVMSALSGTR